MLNWKEEYALGVPRIDEQHRKLFEIAADIQELLNNQFVTDKYDAIVEIIEELKRYTIEHFADEEKFMLEHKFPKFLSHKAMHLDFVEKMNAIDLNQIDNEQNLYLKDILGFVLEWLVQHILVDDKQYTNPA